MTPIERAARAMCAFVGKDDWHVNGDIYVAHATEVLTAAFPGLMSDPPTEWVAPMEATEGMQGSGSDVAMEMGGAMSDMDVARVYERMREAHLKDTPTP